MFNDQDLSDNLENSQINIEQKTRSNLFNWRGQFSPQLVEVLLRSYGFEGMKVLDPFAGSGTVLIESARIGISSYGCEINPAAYTLSRIYELSNVSLKKREKIISNIDEFFDKNFVQLDFEGKLQQEETLKIVASYLEESNLDQKKVLEALLIGLDIGNKIFDGKRLFETWLNLKQKIRDIPFSKSKIKTYLADARKIPLKDNSVDLVITSPPYINVFNYHQNYRGSAEFLGYDILDTAKSEIGSNRKNRSNRFLTVIQYCMDISHVIYQLRRVCKPNSKIIFIVGRKSNVRKTSFRNAKLLKEVFKSQGFILEGSQERVFKNKFGKSIYEEILRFSCGKSLVDNLEQGIDKARKISVKFLKENLKSCSDEVRSDISNAIENSNKVECSKLAE